MLEFYYKYPEVLKRLRNGVLGDEMDRIATHLFDAGYTRGSARIYLERIARFDQFVSQVGVRDIGKIDQGVVCRFLESTQSPSARIAAITAVGLVRRIVRPHLLTVCGYAKPEPDDALLIAYDEHLLQVRGLKPRTREGMILGARRVLWWYREHVSNQSLSAMTGEVVLALIRDLLLMSDNNRTRSAITAHVRSFLRFLRWADIVHEDLDQVVPRVPCWRMAHLPSQLAWHDVRRVIDAIDGKDPIAVRDRALLLLLATTGLRNREMRMLELQDIRWRAAEVVVRETKGRRDRVVPLLAEAGKALADYVLYSRPQVQATQVFLNHWPPARPFGNSSAISAIVRRRLERCNLHLPIAGSHLLRHSLATRLVGQQRPIKEVADLLGHRNIDTTAIYIKVALPQLAMVPLPFPGGQL
jgi:site-specific recombinase XerD